MNWPQYAVVNLRSVSPGQDGWVNAITKFGEGQIKVKQGNSESSTIPGKPPRRSGMPIAARFLLAMAQLLCSYSFGLP